MKLEVKHLYDKELKKEVERFLNLTGELLWRKKIEKLSTAGTSAKGRIYFLATLEQRNPFLRPVSEYFSLREREKREGISIRKHASDDLKVLVTRLFQINRIVQNVNPIAKKRIVGMLKGDDPRPFLFELQIAAHFLVNDFDVDFTDLESSGLKSTFDFYIQKGGISAEVECKYISLDTGRNISRDAFHLLCDFLTENQRLLDSSLLVTIKCRRRLTKNHEVLKNYAARIVEAIGGSITSVELDEHTIAQVKLLESGTKVTSDEEAIKLLAPLGNYPAFVLSNQRRTLAIRSESSKPDDVLQAIFDCLKEGSAQFSGKNPALLACFIEGIEPYGWKELRRETGLANMTYTFFARPNSRHIHTVVYSSEPEIQEMGAAKKYESVNLNFTNPNCQFSLPQGFLLSKLTDRLK